MAAHGRDVWVNDFGREELLRVDGRSGRVVARLPLGRRVALADGRDAVWALRWGGRFFRTPSGPLYRIDPASDRVTPTGSRSATTSPSASSPAPAPCGCGARAGDPLEPGSGAITTAYDFGDANGELTGAVSTATGCSPRPPTATWSTSASRASSRRRSPALVRAELLAVDRGSRSPAAVGALVAVDVGTGRLRWRRPLGFRISTLLPREGPARPRRRLPRRGRPAVGDRHRDGPRARRRDDPELRHHEHGPAPATACGSPPPRVR